MALEMARMCVLAAPMTQAEPKAVASMTGVDEARSSDADGERDGGEPATPSNLAQVRIFEILMQDLLAREAGAKSAGTVPV